MKQNQTSSEKDGFFDLVAFRPACSGGTSGSVMSGLGSTSGLVHGHERRHRRVLRHVQLQPVKLGRSRRVGRDRK